MAEVQIQIHTRHQASETVEQCINASSSEGRAECSGLEGMQPTRQMSIVLNETRYNFIIAKRNQKLMRIPYCSSMKKRDLNKPD